MEKKGFTRTTLGTEFYNKSLDDVRSRYNIKIYSTENKEKSSVVERWISIKNLMWKYFTTYNTTKYIDVLSDIIDKYKSNYHRSIKCSPTEARQPSKFQQVSNALFPPIEKGKKTKFKVWERVQIVQKKTFEKDFTPNWTKSYSQSITLKKQNQLRTLLSMQIRRK